MQRQESETFSEEVSTVESSKRTEDKLPPIEQLDPNFRNEQSIEQNQEPIPIVSKSYSNDSETMSNEQTSSRTMSQDFNSISKQSLTDQDTQQMIAEMSQPSNKSSTKSNSSSRYQTVEEDSEAKKDYEFCNSCKQALDPNISALHVLGKWYCHEHLICTVCKKTIWDLEKLRCRKNAIMCQECLKEKFVESTKCETCGKQVTTSYFRNSESKKLYHSQCLK